MERLWRRGRPGQGRSPCRQRRERHQTSVRTGHDAGRSHRCRAAGPCPQSTGPGPWPIRRRDPQVSRGRSRRLSAPWDAGCASRRYRQQHAREGAGRPLYWTPTVGNPVNNTFMKENAELLDDPSWHRGLPPSIVEDIRASLRLMPGILARPGVVPDLAIYRKKFQQLRDAGAELLVGTDSGNPGHFYPNATWLELTRGPVNWRQPDGVDSQGDGNAGQSDGRRTRLWHPGAR